MTEIFTNITLADFREIKYLNYLSMKLLGKTLEWITSCNKVGSLQKEYREKLFDAKLILIPKEEFLTKESYSYSERVYLSHPKKVIKDLETAEKYFYVYKVNELDLAVLDEKLADIFKDGIKTWKDRIVILNKSSRFSQYKDIVYGINSINCSYSNRLNLQQFMEDDLKRLYRTGRYLKNYCIYYSLGTTAVSTKGLLP